jgi:hydrogenase maturation protein HypF
VGFRPFICRMAAKYGLSGEVDNRSDGVAVIVQGDDHLIDLFRKDIVQLAPPASEVKSIEIKSTRINGYRNFSVSQSKIIDRQITEISPDIAVCSECLEDLEHDGERINYPFINCTNCGPRFTIIEGLPYDRAKTTMKSFPICRNCNSEYSDILNRRFHAQPIACNSCGPSYTFKDASIIIHDIDLILKELCSRLNSGRIVAIKGLGGYHLMCNAMDDNTVRDLRKKKHRDSKPFAVMFRDLSTADRFCCIDEEEKEELESWRRPVLILKQKEILAGAINNGLNTIGAMLPYMPVHHMLFKLLKLPALVMTSGNISDEPVVIDDTKAQNQLTGIADSILSYNRQIYNRADDSVIRFINHKQSLYRRSRGFVPRPVDLDHNVEGILTLGAEQKNSFCIGKGNQAIMSQYIGELRNAPTFNFFKETIDRFSTLFKFRPELIVSDLHPQYLSGHYGEFIEHELKIPLMKVQHHHAHIASCMAEHRLDENVIGVCLDGTGYGEDANTWGGEFFVADLKNFTRYSHFDYIPMPGGDKAVDEPWRMAFSYIFHYFGDRFDYESLPLFKPVCDKLPGIKEMIVKKINSPLSSGAGRLFDAVSAILQLCTVAAFDSEPPMRLESVIDCKTNESYPFEVDNVVIFRETIRSIIDDLNRYNKSLISAKFHNTIAKVILEVTRRLRRETSLNKVVLSGGVFQNKYLLEKTIPLLIRDGFEVYTNHLVPANDGGISLGQLVIASKKYKRCV